MNEKKSKLAAFGNYWKKVGLSFVDSFKYNPAKIPMLILLIPAIVLGFCLVFHFNASKSFVTYNATIIQKQIELGEIILPVDITKEAYAIEHAQSLFSGFQLFALMVCGAVLLFVAMNVSSKRNLASCIQAIIVTVLIIIFGIFWIKNFYRTNYIYNVKQYTEYEYSLTSVDNVVSIACVIVAMISSVVGTVFAFVFRDKSYKKEVM